MKSFLACLSLLLLLSNCTAINFGVGAIIERPEKNTETEQFSVYHTHPHKRMAVYTKKGEKISTYSCDCYFLKITTKETPVHFPSYETTFLLRDGTQTTGTVRYVGISDSVPYMNTYQDVRISLDELDKITFHKSVTDTVYETDERLWLSYDIDFDQTVTYQREEIESILMGFNYFSRDSDSTFVALEEIDRIEYKTGGMGILTGFLTAVGILTDIIIGAILIF